MDGFESAYDGMIMLEAPGYPRGLTQEMAVLSVSAAEVVNAAIAGGSSDSIIKDIIISKAKLSNKITEDLIKKYHASFMALYKSAHGYIRKLEKDIEYLKNPLNKVTSAMIFTPEPASVKTEFLQYVIEANALGVSLLDVLPTELAQQYGMI